MNHDLTTQTGVVAYMSEATSDSDWNKRCDEVKRVNSGWPNFWYIAIIMSGLCAKVTAKWGGDDQIHVTTLKRKP